MFDSNILLTKFGSGIWSRVSGVGPGFYSYRSPGFIPIEVRFGIFVGPFRSVSVSRDTAGLAHGSNLL